MQIALFKPSPERTQLYGRLEIMLLSSPQSLHHSYSGLQNAASVPIWYEDPPSFTFCKSLVWVKLTTIWTLYSFDNFSSRCRNIGISLSLQSLQWVYPIHSTESKGRQRNEDQFSNLIWHFEKTILYFFSFAALFWWLATGHRATSENKHLLTCRVDS